MVLFSLPFQRTYYHYPKYHIRRLCTNIRHYTLRQQYCSGKANFCQGTNKISQLQLISHLIHSPGLQLLHHIGGLIVHHLHNGRCVAIYGKKKKVLQANGEEQSR